MEVLSVERFDEILGLLGDRYSPRDVFNATPTVLFRPGSTPSSKSRQDHLTGYAIKHAIDYGRSRNWYIAEKARAEKLSELIQAQVASVEAELADLKLKLEALKQRQNNEFEVNLADIKSDLEVLEQRQDVNSRKIRSHEVRIDRLRIDKQIKGFPKWLWSRLQSAEKDSVDPPPPTKR